ncbi:uncharacterized protein VTP21DRAFT_3967 [Calcarisporiella thermophila]|uniref:uncharacterized protein n=1 Tax=Calcarisporiella thermophila TaxID=911321 RepID=UPI0037427504
MRSPFWIALVFGALLLSSSHAQLVISCRLISRDQNQAVFSPELPAWNYSGAHQHQLTAEIPKSGGLIGILIDVGYACEEVKPPEFLSQFNGFKGIAVVRRGECTFSTKLTALKNWALAAIIVDSLSTNYSTFDDDDLILMPGFSFIRAALVSNTTGSDLLEKLHQILQSQNQTNSTTTHILATFSDISKNSLSYQSQFSWTYSILINVMVLGIILISGALVYSHIQRLRNIFLRNRQHQPQLIVLQRHLLPTLSKDILDTYPVFIYRASRKNSIELSVCHAALADSMNANSSKYQAIDPRTTSTSSPCAETSFDNTQSVRASPTESQVQIEREERRSDESLSACVICLEDYIEGEEIRQLPCRHEYHRKCVDRWLMTKAAVCPICKFECLAGTENYLTAAEREMREIEYTRAIEMLADRIS